MRLAAAILILAVLSVSAVTIIRGPRAATAAAAGTVPVGYHMVIATNVSGSSVSTISITNTITGANPTAIIKVSNFSVGAPTGVVCRLTADASFISLCTLLFATNQFSVNGHASVWALTNAPTSGSVYFEAVWTSGANEKGISGDVLTNCVAVSVVAATYHADAAPVPGITNTISSTTVNDGLLDMLAVTSISASTFAPQPAGHTEKASVHQSQGTSQHRGGYMQGAATSTVIGWDAVTADDGMTHIVIKGSPP